MTKEDLDDFDFAAAAQAIGKRSGQKLPERRQADRKRLADSDRRAIRATGRTEQMNLRARPEFKREIFNEAKARGLLPIEQLEIAWQFYKVNNGGET